MKHSVCSICGKPLTDPISMQKGIGPVCRIKKKLESMNTNNLFSPRAEYDYDIEGSILWIEDKGGMKSVTNDIENILEDIAASNFIRNRKIMYKDTDGIWDEIKCKIEMEEEKISITNIEFAPIGETDFLKAKRNC